MLWAAGPVGMPEVGGIDGVVADAAVAGVGGAEDVDTDTGLTGNEARPLGPEGITGSEGGGGGGAEVGGGGRLALY